MDFTGEIVHFIYRNEANGYSICVVENDYEAIKAVGVFFGFNEGDLVNITGNEENHPRYGKQLNVEKIKRVEINEEDRLIKLLIGQNIPGIGEVQSKRIVDMFGEKTLEIFEKDIDKLIKIKGIGKKTLEKIKENYSPIFDQAKILMFLQELGISQSKISLIISTYGEDSEEIIKENPYRLCFDIEYFSFKLADKIAFKLGHKKDNSNRTMAFLLNYLNEKLFYGHVFIYKDRLKNDMMKSLSSTAKEVEESINILESMGNIIEDNKKIYLTQSYRSELDIASGLFRLISSANEILIDEGIHFFESKSSIELNKKQKEALKSVFKNGICIITGGPGTGKTTLINAITTIASSSNIALCAPTGRAAKKMEVDGFEAKTIHRLLEYKYVEGEDTLLFERDENNPLDYDIIIVDELSMIDTFLMAHLMKAIKPGTRLVLIGDTDQLPSVGAGKVLNDLINSKKVPVVFLDFIYRQSEISHIPIYSRQIIRGETNFIDENSDDFKVFKLRNESDLLDFIVEYLENLDKNEYNCTQILTPMKKGKIGTRNLNKVIKEIINPGNKNKLQRGDISFKIGDKIMQIKNNYQMEWINRTTNLQGLGVFNGDIGEIIDIDEKEKALRVIYDDDKECVYQGADINELEHAYAVTIHKSQGSEFKRVILLFAYVPDILSNRNLLYTAITRAKEEIIIAGSKNSMVNMTIREDTFKRNTSLKERIEEIFI